MKTFVQIFFAVLFMTFAAGCSPKSEKSPVVGQQKSQQQGTDKAPAVITKDHKTKQQADERSYEFHYTPSKKSHGGACDADGNCEKPQTKLVL